MGALIANDKMSVFTSTAAGGTGANEIGGDQGDTSLGLGTQNHSGPSASIVAPQNEAFHPEERNAGSSTDAMPAGCNSSSVTGGFVACSEPLLVMPAGLSEGAMEGMGDNDIGSADWLDITHALLDTSNEPDHA